ncbi:hypothetical protein GYMLUDRAFT_823231 [Collybiopsis luxurians FD-317 M1]|uniref:G domain-containing protein n=1 Tax=Collybiopsis luxurians FD-317 M1 TaxID=944289 RepID=A0A0D0BMY6_9AGAR|nr:hypothetical protein GYMLUDRAFT_823231 [Collybiopsis luxurians FD-317 M1]
MQTSINSSTSFLSPPSPTTSTQTNYGSLNGNHGAVNSAIIEQELASSTEEIFATCPKFRILVLGKSGAGKSSLINATFNVDLAHVSHEQSGVSNIDEEITSEQNSRFILHDSQGFAAGETQNFETVERFIKDRAQRPELKDRLHAIWFCMEIPTENGALFETADQNFLKLDLENVPVIVVFTKYDLLISKLEKEAMDDVDDEELENLVRQRADRIFEEACIQPLRAITCIHSYVKVSSKRNDHYRDTLVNLVTETRNRLDERMWVLWAMVQRASVDDKINACVAVGRRKYWRGLASSLHFPGKSLKQCLDRIHDDIIKVWNFNDPHELLQSPDFRILLGHMVEDLDERPSPHARQVITTVTSAIGVVTSIIPGAVVIAIPAAAGVAIAQWLLFAYQETPDILQLMMGYICDLTTVLQCLFWIMRVHGDALEVEPHLIELAIDAHKETGAQQFIHRKIRSFIAATPTFKLHKKDLALDELVQIIQSVRFKPEKPSGSGRPRALSMISDYSISSTLSTAGSTIGV